jgi:hypothetical protein|nr:MAG TPA_asm: hypothetical protein [Caudoviricetes sp.]
MNVIDTVEKGVMRAVMRTGCIESINPLGNGKYEIEYMQEVDENYGTRLDELVRVKSMGDYTTDVFGFNYLDPEYMSGISELWLIVAEWDGTGLRKTYVAKGDIERAFKDMSSWCEEAWILMRNGYTPYDLSVMSADEIHEEFCRDYWSAEYPYLRYMTLSDCAYDADRKLR